MILRIIVLLLLTVITVTTANCGTPIIPNGDVVPEINQGTLNGDTVNYTCNDGYSSSNYQIVCQADGNWSSSTCTQKDCGTPVIPNGNVVQGTIQGTLYGDTVDYTCNEGYNSSNSQIVCQADGEWSSSTCTQKDCGTPVIPNGNVVQETIQGTLYGDTVDYTCTDGYNSSNSQIVCQADGEWSSSTCTKKDCGPPYIPYGNVVPETNQGTLYADTVNYTCIDGYNSSNYQIVCQADGNWSSSTCTKKECSLVCQNGGTCNTTAAESICLCPDGFKGVTCEVEDFCVTQPCPAGECVTVNNSSRFCICPSGRRGLDCELTDQPTVCTDIERFIYFDNPEVSANRTVCMQRSESQATDICSDPDGAVSFEIPPEHPFVQLVSSDPFCFNLTTQDPAVPRQCVNVIARPTEDLEYRLWNNATSQVCFTYNRRPSFEAPTPMAVVTFNVYTMADNVFIPLGAQDPDDHQTTTFTVLDVQPADFQNNFRLNATGLVVNKPTASLLPVSPKDVIVTVKVVDNGVPVLYAVKNITVRFVNESLLCQLPQDTYYVHTSPLPVNTIELGQIQCTGQPRETLTYQLLDSPAAPVTVSSAGLIQYDPSIPEAKTGTLNINVLVVSESPTGNIEFRLSFILVTDDLSPSCSAAGTLLSFKETDAVGMCKKYNCSSLDPSALFQCNDESSDFNIVCNSTGIFVCVNQSIRNRIQTFSVTGAVTNKHGSIGVSLTINVLNVNDRPTITQNATALGNVQLDETAAIGSTVISIGVIDPDIILVPIVDSLTTSLLDAATTTLSSVFKSELNAAQNSITISLRQALNINIQKTYSLTLLVTDSSGITDSVPITINIRDVNQPPVCITSLITMTVSVRISVGTVLTTLSCTDNDIEPTFRSLTYSITSSNFSGYFTVGSSSGVVSTANSLVNLTQPGMVVSISVTVRDGGGLNTSVTLMMNISNTFPPECNSSRLSFSLSEDTVSATCSSLALQCQEPVQNGSLSYTVINGNGTSLFRLDSITLSLCTTAALKGRIGVWQLTIRANSTYGATDISVSVTVNDVNDPPSFSTSSYQFSIPENITVGSSVAMVTASDQDTGVLGTLTYYSQGQEGIEGSSVFALDSNTGLITVKAPLDAELRAIYVFRMLAIDGAPTSITATTTVSITVVDVNDSPPVCTLTANATAINVTATVGDYIATLKCTDADSTPAFRQQTYTLVGSDVFGVNSTGTIKIVKPLGTERSYNFSVTVRDFNKPELLTTVLVQLVVNTNFPPYCDQHDIVVPNVSEVAPSGYCLGTAVTCTDPLGSNTALVNGSVTGSGSSFVEIRDVSLGGGRLSLSLCSIAILKKQFGTYQVSARVTNQFAETTIRWTFTIFDVNEPPAILNLPNTTSIKETQQNAEIFTVSITDPDDQSTVFGQSSVTAMLTNSEDFNNQLSNSVFFVDAAAIFYATGTMNATIRDKYVYLVNVTDGGGLWVAKELVINILDVNEAPFCDTLTSTREVTILIPVGSTVLKVNCHDSDKTPNNTKLDYRITSGDKDNYFNMTADGSVIIAKQLPRTILYNTGVASLTVTVTDRGIPPLNTSVTVVVTVDNQIAVTCSPVITPPAIWVIDSCAIITMDCTDPTTNTSDHLDYTPSGNFSRGFKLTNNSNGILTLCYNQTGSNIYEIFVEVNNGLKVYVFREMILVSYSQATPVFSLTKYATSVSENIAVGTTVIAVSASSQNLIGLLEYHVIDSDSTPGWSNHFILNKTTGVFRTTASLRPISNEQVVIRVEAEDTGSRLKSTAQVEINVIDINEVPKCTISVRKPAVNVDTLEGTVIAAFNCSDADRKAEYNTLKYSISESSATTFKLLETSGKYSIVTQKLLDVNMPAYNIQLTVADSATPPLSFKETFNVTVNLLPPAVKMVAVALMYNIIEVSWSYERSEFNAVTNSYDVIIQPPGDAVPITSPQLGTDINKWNATGLNAVTKYGVSVKAYTTHGIRQTPVTVVSTPEVPQLSKVTVIIRLPQIVYNDRLQDNGSIFYYDTSQTVLNNVRLALRNTAGFMSVRVVRFRPANSIFADLEIVVNQTGTIQNTVNVLNETIATGFINNLSVDSVYFVVALGGHIDINTINKSPNIIYNGTVVAITCEGVTVGFPNNASFLDKWTLDGNLIHPSDNSPYSITFAQHLTIPEIRYTTLKIDPVLARHAGTYGCIIQNREGTVSATKTIVVEVISQPVVMVTPKSDTVAPGSAVNITCELDTTTLSSIDAFSWYINDVLFQERTGFALEQELNKETLVVSSLTLTTVFGCQGRNTAGYGHTVYSHIGVTRPGVSKCGSTTDGRGTTWPETVSGTKAVLVCQQGHIGDITRYCDVRGMWENPEYSCVTSALANISNEVSKLADGASGTNKTEILEQFVTATSDIDLLDGDLEVSINSLDTLSQLGTYDQGDSITVAEDDTDNFLRVGSNLIDERNKPTWVARLEKLKSGAINVPGSVEQYIQGRINDLYFKVASTTSKVFNLKNIYAEVGVGPTDEPYQFPDRSKTQAPDWIKKSSTRISVQANTFKDLQSVLYGASFYRNITSILERKLFQDGVVKDVSTQYDINSDIVSLKVRDLTTSLDPPVLITFEHFDSNYSNPICCYWDFTDNTFKTDGCSLKSTSADFTECACTHLTNFAILMSPGVTPEADVMALSIISAVGCAISIFCLLLTIILHLIVWKYIKSDRAILLLNLCMALIISYAIFLGGVGRADMEDVCTAISLLLHYFYLVVFFLMLSYGIEILVSVKFVFVTRSRVKWLLPLAWLIPLVIVIISAGVTKLEGYGNERFCWLSVDTGLLYAFVAPAGLCILINFIVIVIVFRTMFKSSAMLTKSDKEKAKVGVRSACVLLPILGLTWIFGVFSVNESLVAFQYIFAILNSLQGLFIFIFHAVLNKQLKDGLKKRGLRKKSLATFESEFKNLRSSNNVHNDSSIMTGEKKNNDISTQGSNPFLEVDRQVHAMELAHKKRGTNLYDNTDSNKLDHKSKAVDLEDVKISNILHESEMMSGTEGISSILQAQKAGQARHQPDTKNMSASRKSYDYIDSVPSNQSSITKPSGYETLLLSASGKNQPYSSINKGYNSDTERSKDREREKEKQRHREQEEREREKSYQPVQVRVGYDTRDRTSKDSKDSKGLSKSSRSSKSDEDKGSHLTSSSQNITSINTAIPMKFDQYQSKQKKPEVKKKKTSGKDRERSRDRSRDYEYPFETTYMGGQSRHASLENVNMHNYGYSPYVQMPSMNPYHRPTRTHAHQPQQWDPYGARHYQDPYDPYKVDYW